MIKENELQLSNEAYNGETRKKHLVNEINRSFWNHDRMVENLKSGMAMDLTDAPKAEDAPILIIGSGPSFDRVAPYLKDWKGDIMCSTSQAATCIYYGKNPKFIVALDPESFDMELTADDFAGRDCILIAHPGVTTGLIDFWQGKSYYFRKILPQTAFYSNAQRIGYSTTDPEHKILIKESLIMLACVAAAQVCIAKILGYKRMYLCGLDFGCPAEQTRFTQYKYSYEKKVFAPGNAPEIALGTIGRWEKQNPPPMTAAENVLGENGCKTSNMQAFYKLQFMTGWWILKGDFVNVSSDGLLYELPQTTIEEVIRKQGEGIKGFHQKKVCEVADVYLARHNTFVIEIGPGKISVMQCKDPLKEIPIVIDRLTKASKEQGQPIKINKRANMIRIGRILKQVGWHAPAKALAKKAG